VAVYTMGPPVAMPGNRAITWSDARISNLDTLYARALRRLTELQVPQVSYVVTALDLSEIQVTESEAVTLGDNVHLVDDDLLVDQSVRIVKIVKDLGDSAALTLTLENAPQDFADYMADVIAVTQAIDDPLQLESDHVSLTADYTLQEWQYSALGVLTGRIDGAKIQRGTLPETMFGEVTADQTGLGTVQRYQVRLLDPIDNSYLAGSRITDLGLSSAYIDDAQVPDDDAPALQVGDRVRITIPSMAQRTLGEKPRATPGPTAVGGGGGGGGGTAQYQFVCNEGDSA